MDIHLKDLLVFLIFVHCTTITLPMPMPTPQTDDMTMDQIENYMEKHGYYGDGHPDDDMKEMAKTNKSMALHEGLMLFQKTWNMDMTGEADEKTIAMMMMPRCGVKDFKNMGDMMRRRKKRYLLQGDKWENHLITYKITRFPSNQDATSMTRDEIHNEIERAFRVWEEVSPLRFSRLPDSDQLTTPDIEIHFSPTRIDHGDGYPFDGESGTLAHAFYPQSGQSAIEGDTHFDLAEKWTLNTDEGINLFQVAAHEFGHAVGLGHSTNQDALMAPFYQGFQKDFILPRDDELGIQAKYGRPTMPRTIATNPPAPTVRATRPTTTTTAQSRTMMPEFEDICRDGIFDAVTTMHFMDEYHTYAFRARYYFRIENGDIAVGHPRLISDDFPGIPDNVDGALFFDAQYDQEWVWDDEKREWIINRFVDVPASTYIFKGSQFWIIRDMRVTSGPDHVSELGFPENIDAAFVWKQNGKVYIFKGDYYYRYTEGVGIDPGYPQPNSRWGEIPSPVDAALQHIQGTQGENKSTLFFGGNQVYLYHDEIFRVMDGYPVTTNPNWLSCENFVSSASLNVCSQILLYIIILVTTLPQTR